jgi:hypothetical protein
MGELSRRWIEEATPNGVTPLTRARAPNGSNKCLPLKLPGSTRFDDRQCASGSCSLGVCAATC